ncbi:MAG: hypothetical protein WCT40_03235 [Candidatus Magasanikbacteria bacterium]|jgi:hypothetical protein
MPEDDKDNKKPQGKPEEVEKVTPEVGSDTPASAEIKAGESFGSNSHDDFLKIDSVSGDGVKKVSDDAFSLDKTAEFDLGMDKLSPKEQHNAAGQVASAQHQKRNAGAPMPNSGQAIGSPTGFGPEQSGEPSANPDAFNPPESAPLTPGENDAQKKPTTDRNDNPESSDGQPPADPTPGQPPTGGEPGTATGQDQQQQAATDMRASQQQARLDQLQDKSQGLNKDADEMLNAPEVSLVVRRLLPKLHGEINEVYNDIKGVKEKDRGPILRQSLKKISQLRSKISRLIIWGGILEGMIKWLLHLSAIWHFIITIPMWILLIPAYIAYGLTFGKLKMALSTIMNGLDGTIKKLKTQINRDIIKQQQRAQAAAEQ